jgi:hypothetical protein
MSKDKTKSDNDTSTARSAKAQKAEEVQLAGTAKAGGTHGEAFVPEGGPAPAPKRGKGAPMPAASRAAADDAPEAGASSATVGKAEKEAAARKAALTKDQHGRGHRKAE